MPHRGGAGAGGWWGDRGEEGGGVCVILIFCDISGLYNEGEFVSGCRAL